MVEGIPSAEGRRAAMKGMRTSKFCLSPAGEAGQKKSSSEQVVRTNRVFDPSSPSALQVHPKEYVDRVIRFFVPSFASVPQLCPRM